MPTTAQNFFIALIIFLSVCACSYVFISPYSFNSFIGPAAGITTALVVLYGASILLAIITATVLFSIFLFYWVELPIESSMIIITLLAFMLQGVWAKQLTSTVVYRQKWLKSRRNLLLFLFKVGPINSLIAAFAVIILTMLENQAFSENVLFTFASCWSSSVLFSTFFTPLFLLFQGGHQLNTSKRFFILVASLLAFFAIVLLFNISQNFQQHQRKDTFNKTKVDILHQIQHEVDTTTTKLTSLAALLKVNPSLTRHQFDNYSAQVLRKESSIRVFEWAPMINHEQRKAFEQNIALINEKKSGASFTIANKREQYAPIKFVYPSSKNEMVIGLDVLSNNKNTIDMENIIVNSGIVASAPISLLQDDHENIGVLFITAISDEFIDNTSTKGVSTLSKNHSGVLGFAIAVLQFESFFQRISPSKSANLALFIEDVTANEPYVLFGRQLNEKMRYIDSTYLNVNSRKWRISIGEVEAWQLQSKNWQVWGLLFGATLGGFLFQMLILMMAVYSNELSAQVVRKTRELIIAKEQSEHQNTAKTNFLYTLTRDLQVPLQAISHYTNQLKNTNVKEQKKVVINIESAQYNMKKLLNMVVDLSQIELGEVVISNNTFDFYGFINSIDAMLKASLVNKGQSITFLVDDQVPHFINSDELRIQQLLMAVCDEVHGLFTLDNIRVSIKTHNHNSKSAALFFVFTAHDEQVTENKVPFDDYIAKDIALYSTELAMVKDICHLLSGDANLAVSDSGERVLTVSIKIDITSVEQQQSIQAQTFDKSTHKDYKNQ